MTLVFLSDCYAVVSRLLHCKTWSIASTSSFLGHRKPVQPNPYSDYVTGCTSKESWFDCWHGIQTGSNSIWAACSLGLKQPGREVDHSSYLMLRLQMSGTTPSVSHVTSSRAHTQDNICPWSKASNIHRMVFIQISSNKYPSCITNTTCDTVPTILPSPCHIFMF
jgi:hypothetical protein